MWPPDCLMKPNTMLRPRPVPLPGSLVVKNGSKMRVEHLRRHAGAGVADLDHHVVAGRHLGVRGGVVAVEVRRCGWRSPGGRPWAWRRARCWPGWRSPSRAAPDRPRPARRSATRSSSICDVSRRGCAPAACSMSPTSSLMSIALRLQRLAAREGEQPAVSSAPRSAASSASRGSSAGSRVAPASSLQHVEVADDDRRADC